MIATQAKNSRCIDNFMDGARFSEQSTTQWMANEDQYGTHTHTANVAFEMSKKVKNHFFCGWSERKRNELRIGRKLGNGRGRRSNMRETNYAKFNRACPVHLLICPFVQYRRGKGQRCVLCCASEQNSFFFGHFRKWKTHQSDIWWETQLPDCVSVGLRSNSYTFASSHHSCIRAFVHCPLDTGEEMSITHAKNKFPSPKTSSAYINVSYPFNVKIVHCWKPSKPTQKHCFFLFCFHSVPNTVACIQMRRANSRICMNISTINFKVVINTLQFVVSPSQFVRVNALRWLALFFSHFHLRTFHDHFKMSL